MSQNLPPVSPRDGGKTLPPVSPRSAEEKKVEEVEEDFPTPAKDGDLNDDASIADSVASALSGGGDFDPSSGGAQFDLESSIESAIVVVEEAEKEKTIPITEREATEEEQKASAKIQGVARINLARSRVQDVCRATYEQVFDNDSGRYFYFNKKTGESLWEKPLIMGDKSMDERDEWAATQLQKMYRKKLARKHLGDMSKQWFEKAYDPDTKSFYYVRRMDQTTRWDKPPFIAKNDDADLGPDSKKFLDRDEEIAHLKKLLKEKERLIKHTEKARYQELDEKLRNERLLEAKTEPRGKQMDEWTMAEVVAWFESLGFPEYEPALILHKVDGLLLLNMEEQDWEELGVTSKLHARKIQVNMKKYQMRYENKLNKKEKGSDESSSDEDSGLSDLSISSDPSDLLEELEEEDEEGKEAMEEEEEEDDEVLPPTEEELLEIKRDEENVSIEIIYPGDGKTHPKNGDVVQLHYTAMITDTGAVIESSRKMRHRPFEFVVGAGQVVKGWDVAIKKFSFGERSKVKCTAKYSYGSKGFPPSIPPNSDMTFDLELIKWWKRPMWVKPLIQQPGLSQKPYTREEQDRSGAVGYGDSNNVKLDSAKGDDEFSSDSGED
jgi:FK506-binding protein 1